MQSRSSGGTKAYGELKKLGKSDADIINSAGRPQASLKRVGQSIFDELGEEALPILKKYKMAPKK